MVEKDAKSVQNGVARPVKKRMAFEAYRTREDSGNKKWRSTYLV